MLNWLVSIPWSYFETLFINEQNWLQNNKLVNLLNDAEVIDGESCALVIQAFFLNLLSRIIINDTSYHIFSLNLINDSINNKISKGNEIIKLSSFFENEFQKVSPDEWQTIMFYQIVNFLYIDNEKASSKKYSLLDPKLHMAVEIYLTELIKTAKENNETE